MPPLAISERPKTLDGIIGHDDLKNNLLIPIIEQKHPISLIFYGAPGSGKTTIANVLANQLDMVTRNFNAAIDNKKTLTDIFELTKYHDQVIVIIDEIHRLNKDKQDLLLPYLESGKIVVFGCTTSNPLMAINPAIRSRTHLIEITPLSKKQMFNLLANDIKKHFDGKVTFDDSALKLILEYAQDDIRYALNLIELITINNQHIDEKLVKTYGSYQNQYVDKNSDNHYNLLSAFQKAIRGSDVNASLYYLAQLIKAGDLESITRRLLTCAYEDIGLANPNLCMRTYIAIQAANQLGLPEGRIPLSDIVIELALSPKSKSGERAIDEALEIKEHYQMPAYLKFNDLDSNYDYNDTDNFDKLQYLPDELVNVEFYHPNNNQIEDVLKNNLTKLSKNKRYKK